MSVREYIGARYVPIFAEPLTWDPTNTYEPLTVVLYQGNSYTSRQAVPANIDISNTTYWAQTGNYNAQVEQYRAEVQTFNGRITTIEGDLPASAFDSTNTVKKYVDDSVAQIDQDVSDLQELIPSTDFDDTNTVKSYIDSQFDSVDEKADTNALKIKAAQGGSVVPFWLGAFAEPNPLDWGHGGGIASNGTYQACISSNSQQNDMGKVVFINIDSNDSLYMQPRSILMGHGNSICYHKRKNVFIIAPEFSYASGDAVQWRELLVYSADFATMTRVQTPQGAAAMQSVSYDHVTGKLYALGMDDILYEVSDEYVFTEVGEISRAGVYNQDFAVYDGIFYNSSPSGFIKYGRIDTCEILGYMDVSNVSNNGMFCLGELNGMEFDEYGHLLACGDYSPSTGISYNGYIYSVFQIPTKNSPIFFPNVDGAQYFSNPNYRGITVNAGVHKLRGLTVDHPNLVASFAKVTSPFMEVTFDSDFSTTGDIALVSNPSLQIRTNGNHTISCSSLVFNTFLHFFGSGTFRVANLQPLTRAPHVAIETGTTIVGTGNTAEVAGLFAMGAVVMNGGTPQNSALFFGQNLGTYRSYINSRTPVYVISG